jgi:16S rRNA (cytosine1402-N4)-methyltransferase
MGPCWASAFSPSASLAEDIHEPVLVTEVVGILSGADVVVDLTVGLGGHARALLDSGVDVVVGIDRDAEALAEAGRKLAGYGSRFRPVRSTFGQPVEAVEGTGLQAAGGILYDLGVSSLQLDRAERGFSYRSDGPLDMRMGEGNLTAAHIVNTYGERDLERIIREHGEERFAGRIARSIVRARRRAPLGTTRELAAVVAAAVPRRRGGPHPARRTFQALRIEVNRELEELAASLPRAVQLLIPGGRMVVIAYHSLEDRITKRFLQADDRLEILTRKPVRPAAEEAERNPRARSAKLRAAERKAA